MKPRNPFPVNLWQTSAWIWLQVLSDMIMVFFIVYPNNADLQLWCNVLLWPPHCPAPTSAHILFLSLWDETITRAPAKANFELLNHISRWKRMMPCCRPLLPWFQEMQRTGRFISRFLLERDVFARWCNFSQNEAKSTKIYCCIYCLCSQLHQPFESGRGYEPLTLHLFKSLHLLSNPRLLVKVNMCIDMY